MDKDKRNHPRFSPKGLTAHITINPPPPKKQIIIDGTIIDMSYTGIKIKLHTAITSDLSESEIKINLTMPESGIPISIHGIIKHLNDESECGLRYSNKHTEDEVDDLMFECIKIAENHTQKE